MRKWIVLTMTVILASGTLLAQRGPLDNHRRERDEQQTLKKMLGLSDEQLSAIDDLRRANRDEIREIFQAARENGGKLREEMRKETPDSAVVGSLMIETQAAGKKAEVKRDELHEKVRAVLTDEQSAKLADMEGDPASRRALAQARSIGLLEQPDHGRRGGRPRGFGRRGPAGPGGRGPSGFDRSRGRRGFSAQRNFRRQGNPQRFQHGPGRSGQMGSAWFRGSQRGPRSFRGAGRR